MKILFVPLGGRSHQIPLYVFYKRYFSRMSAAECAFLLPAIDHKFFKKQNINVLDLDYQFHVFMDVNLNIEKSLAMFIKEKETIKKFQPDIIIEDLSFGTAVISELYKIPRISIQRTGFFLSSNPALRNPNHVHSLEKDVNFDRTFKVLSYKKPDAKFSHEPNLEDIRYYTPTVVGLESFEILNSKIKIIPGIPSIEKLHPLIKDDSYFYSGPLNMMDNPSESFVKSFNDFCDHNRNKKKIFITLGTVEKLNISDLVNYIHEKGYALITTIPLTGDFSGQDTVFYNPIVPLNLICSKADLIIHQCGSGIYHYALLHLKPTITLGTQCYDREEIALELERIGVSAHTPSFKDDANYFEKFKIHFERFENNNLCDFNKLDAIRAEIIKTTIDFKIEKVLNKIAI